MKSSTAAAANPFSIRSVIVLLVIGSALFVALLWLIGTGLGASPANNGGNHAEGKGLNGYAALYRMWDKQGYELSRSRSSKSLSDNNLLVLTPPHGVDAKQLNALLTEQRWRGPTLIILPKWQTSRMPPMPGSKSGWVQLTGASSPDWLKEIEHAGSLNARIAEIPPSPQGATWSGLGLSGPLPNAQAVQSITADGLTPLVRDAQGRTLAGILAPPHDNDQEHAVIVVAEPDLLNNYGFASLQSAQLASAILSRATDSQTMPVVFDLTLNGLGQQPNLLTLAFTPPFLAATLCLIMAAIAIGWRALVRFGAPRKSEQAIAFGKEALVANTAGMIRRTRRLHLLTSPYADRAVDTMARSLALARQPDRAATEVAIDRALHARTGQEAAFSHAAERLRSAKSPHQAVEAAQEIHSLERKLIG